MGKIKLLKLAKELGVGVASLTDALQGKGFEVENNPNARIGKEEFDVLLNEMVKSKEERDRITKVFLRDPNESANQRAAEQSAAPKKEMPMSQHPKEQVIRASVSESDKPKFKVVDKIDLNANKPKPANKPVSATHKVEEKPKQAAPKPHIEAPKVEKQQQPAKDKTPTQLKVESHTPTEKPVTAAPKPNTEAPKADKQEEKPAVRSTIVDQSKPADLPTVAPTLNGPKVVGNIDLSQFKNDSGRGRGDKKKGKRTRTTTSGQHVNIDEEIKKANKGSGKNGQRNQQGKGGNQQGGQKNAGKPEGNKGGGNKSTGNADANKGNNNNQQNKGQGSNNAAKKTGRKQRERERDKAALTQEEIDKAVKENLARLTNKSTETSRAAKRRKDKRDARNAAARDAMNMAEDQTIQLTEFVTVSDLATLMDVQVNEVIKTCMEIGLMVNINQRLEADTINLLAEEFGFKTEFVSASVVEAIENAEEEDDPNDMVERPPIVTVMGHVDHGKTSLLDRIRNTNVIAGEAGGITQHIGAYNLTLENGKHITFLDTPGHEAFTAMRARGAKITDIAIIIIAADDSVMPQTKEAINHASAAGVPIVFAINKIDNPSANPDKIREELAAMNYLVEEWGGKYQCQEISAKKGVNIDKLLEKVLLEAELLELKANPKRNAMGNIIESSLDKGRGYIATVMVQNGTLRVGDTVLAGTHYGRVKAMFNERNQRVKEAGPSVPVLLLGLNGAPTAGDNFHVLDTEQEARAIATKREQLQREQDNRMKRGLTLEELARRKALGNFQELNLIIKGDVDGSVEALADSLAGLSTEEIQVNVIHKGVGQISESDVVLASASSAIVIGFQVRPSASARRLAEQEGVEIRTYSIIYDTIEEVKSAMEGMLSPEIKEQITANLEVLQVFKVSKVGSVAGCMVTDGKIKRTHKIRLIRDGIVKYAGELGSLKRYKDDAKEVVAGQDCGLNIDGYNDIMVGDIIEAYEEIEIKKTL